MEKILVVEDDIDINNLLTKIMKKQGFEVEQAFSGSEADLRLQMGKYDLILLDLMLPGMMGEDVIRKVRENCEVPIIVLSAKSSLEDRVNVLNLGADDYLTKPFEKDEVIARVNASLRRYRRFQNNEEQSASQKLQYKQLTVLVEERQALVGEHELELTAHEFDILCLMLKNPGKVFSRENLYEEIWQGGYYGEDNTVNMHVSNLRKKIGARTEEEYIQTVWGIGYKLV